MVRCKMWVSTSIFVSVNNPKSNRECRECAHLHVAMNVQVPLLMIFLWNEWPVRRKHNCSFNHQQQHLMKVKDILTVIIQYSNEVKIYIYLWHVIMIFMKTLVYRQSHEEWVPWEKTWSRISEVKQECTNWNDRPMEKKERQLIATNHNS